MSFTQEKSGSQMAKQKIYSSAIIIVAGGGVIIGSLCMLIPALLFPRPESSFPFRGNFLVSLKVVQFYARLECGALCSDSGSFGCQQAVCAPGKALGLNQGCGGGRCLDGVREGSFLPKENDYLAGGET